MSESEAPHRAPEARAPMLDRLLSGTDAPAVTEQEALFARIEAEVAPPSRPWWRSAWSLGSLVAAAAALLLFLRWPATTSDDFRPRGTPSASLQLRCIVGGAVAPCARGADLALTLRSTAARPFVAAFSRRPDGVIVWYIPAEDGESHHASPEPSVFHLGDDHPPGSYRLYAVFSAQALDREAIAAAMGEDLRGGPSVSVVTETLEIAR